MRRATENAVDNAIRMPVRQDRHERQERPPEIEHHEELQRAAAAAPPQSDFISPFAEEDELEVPAFIRRARQNNRTENHENGERRAAFPAPSFSAFSGDRRDRE
jgi:hypothetical protein